MIAARVAAELGKQEDVKVETQKGGLGELSVSVDGLTVFDSSRLWYPTTGTVLKKVRESLSD
jgi:hypothetical protein